MKKLKFLMTFLLIFSVTFTFAKKDNEVNGVTLISANTNQTILRFEIDSYDLKSVRGLSSTAVELVAPNTGKILKKGAPALLKQTASIIIPDTAATGVEVIDSAYTELYNIDLAPSKGVLMRTVNPDDVPYEYGPEYRTNAFYPTNVVELNKAYIARDFRGQAVAVHPFQYNPVTQTLRVYTQVTVRVSQKDGKGDNEFKRQKPLNFKKLHREFKKLYSRHFINYKKMEADAGTAELELQYTPLNDPIGNMLIVCYNGFMADMSDFVSWKQSIGYTVDLVDYSTIGSSTALKNYVINYYNTNGLTYLLLVGDHAQVPTSSTSYGDSDNNYGYIVGGDHYLDIFVGRFSAETPAHVQTQVDRTIHYERDVLSSEEFFRHAIGMGSSEGPGHNGEYDYQHINLILDDLEGYGYTTHECHQSGGSPALMSSFINAGSGTIFYCGHGTVNSWYTSSWSYTSTDVNGLVNDNILPFVVSVACVVGNFRSYTCYSEVWQRATNNGVPTGAVANAGSTINQSWIPPMDAEDEMADLLVAKSMRTFGGMFANGLFKMIDINGSAGESMADTWVCFGDPSVQMRTPGTPNGPIPGNQPPVADFTYSVDGLTVTFTDQSYDPDGTIVSWLWDFGDGTTSTVQNPIHTYASSGSYSVSLTVTDNEGANSKVTKIISVGSLYMYVYDISMSLNKAGRNYTATAVITIRDTNGNPVPDATVSVTWSGCYSSTTSGVTGSDGTVTFTSAKVKCSGPFTITVNNVTHATIPYDPGLNNETSDSITY